jgi:hypothetical protein
MGHLVQTVPDDIAQCEFHCSKTDCSHTEWNDCKRRLDPFNDALRLADPAAPGRLIRRGGIDSGF